MNLQKAKDFAAQKKARGVVSDGCTFAPDFDIGDGCYMHDIVVTFFYS